jgi:hypothetical protein
MLSMLARMTISLALFSLPAIALAQEQAPAAGQTREPAPYTDSRPLIAWVAPQAAPARPAPASQPDIETLIRQGNKSMREGDILGARALYREAFATGDAAAALVMARSYDPVYAGRIAGRNAEPDAAKALEWYGRARDAGAGLTAEVRIEELRHFLDG